MNDLEDKLIGGQGRKGQEKRQQRFDECENKIKAVRAKNNELQKQCVIRLKEILVPPSNGRLPSWM